MKAPYPAMVEAVTAAANAIKAFVTCYPRQLPDEQWEQYADAADHLRHGLKQLNTMLNIEYSFEEGLPEDILNYAALLKEHNVALEVLVGYLLGRSAMFGGDTYKYETYFLRDVLATATASADAVVSIFVG